MIACKGHTCIGPYWPEKKNCSIAIFLCSVYDLQINKQGFSIFVHWNQDFEAPILLSGEFMKQDFEKTKETQ